MANADAASTSSAPTGTSPAAAAAALGAVRVKQEKHTPPTTPVPHASHDGDHKTAIGPVKSSTQLLDELFQTFRTTVPNDLFRGHLANASGHAEKKHKKHKKQKKQKKSKHRPKDDDTDDDDDADESRRRRSAKRIKTEPSMYDAYERIEVSVTNDRLRLGHAPSDDVARRRAALEAEAAAEAAVVRAAAAQAAAQAEEAAARKRHEAMRSEAFPAGSGVPQKPRIIIQNLAQSSVLKDARHYEQQQQRGSRRSEDNGELSLSDEDAYERDRDSRHYHQQHHHQQNRYDEAYDGGHRSSGGRSDAERWPRSSRDEHHRHERRHHHRHDDYEDDYVRDRRSGSSRSRRDADDSRVRRSSSRRHSEERERIDKKRLLEIARRNAIQMLENGKLPGATNISSEAREKIITKMRTGGKTVDELTEFCKKLSAGESGTGYLSDDGASKPTNGAGRSDNSDDELDGNDSDAERRRNERDARQPFNHPFLLKDRAPIVMNIRNSVPIAPKSAEQTKAVLMQYPVSSGQHHRLNESEWVPVADRQKKTSAVPGAAMTSTSAVLAPERNIAVVKPTAPIAEPAGELEKQLQQYEQQVKRNDGSDNIFMTNAGPGAPNASADVTSIISQRLSAMRKLQENPNDTAAKQVLNNSESDLSSWANSKNVPGKFIGSTGANILSSRELTSGYQAWAKRSSRASGAPEPQLNGVIGLLNTPPPPLNQPPPPHVQKHLKQLQQQHHHQHHQHEHEQQQHEHEQQQHEHEQQQHEHQLTYQHPNHPARRAHHEPHPLDESYRSGHSYEQLHHSSDCRHADPYRSNPAHEHYPERSRDHHYDAYPDYDNIRPQHSDERTNHDHQRLHSHPHADQHHRHDQTPAHFGAVRAPPEHPVASVPFTSPSYAHLSRPFHAVQHSRRSTERSFNRAASPFSSPSDWIPSPSDDEDSNTDRAERRQRRTKHASTPHRNASNPFTRQTAPAVADRAPPHLLATKPTLLKNAIGFVRAVPGTPEQPEPLARPRFGIPERIPGTVSFGSPQPVAASSCARNPFVSVPSAQSKPSNPFVARPNVDRAVPVVSPALLAPRADSVGPFGRAQPPLRQPSNGGTEPIRQASANPFKVGSEPFNNAPEPIGRPFVQKPPQLNRFDGTEPNRRPFESQRKRPTDGPSANTVYLPPRFMSGPRPDDESNTHVGSGSARNPPIVPPIDFSNEAKAIEQVMNMLRNGDPVPDALREIIDQLSSEAAMTGGGIPGEPAMHMNRPVVASPPAIRRGPDDGPARSMFQGAPNRPPMPNFADGDRPPLMRNAEFADRSPVMGPDSPPQQIRPNGMPPMMFRPMPHPNQCNGPIGRPMPTNDGPPMAFAGPGPINNCGPGPMNSFGPGPINDSGPGPMNDFRPRPNFDFGPGPMNDCGPGPMNDFGPGPINFGPGPINDYGPGPMNNFDNGSIVQLSNFGPGPMNSFGHPGPMNDFVPGPMNGCGPGPMNGFGPGPMRPKRNKLRRLRKPRGRNAPNSQAPNNFSDDLDFELSMDENEIEAP